MNLHILGSSSKGNGYILTNGRETLLIECGVRFNDVKKELDYNVSSIVGVLVSHRHGDHAKYLADYAKTGVRFFAGSDVIEKFSIQNAAVIQPPLCKTTFGRFSVLAFEVSHDVPCYGFHIHHPETGNILFLTDTYLCEYTFPNLTHILVEANYAADILDENMKSGRVDRFMKDRVWKSHMELETTKGVLRSNDLMNVRNIVLIHLSDSNSDEQRFISEVQAATGKPIKAAKKGLKLNFEV